MARISKEKEAALPQKLLHKLLSYDGLTGGFVNKTKRGANAVVGQVTGCLNKLTGYLVIKINGYSYQAHRLAWVYVHGDYPDGEQPFVDHINGKKDDNRIINLRVSSGGENQRNMKMHLSNKSGANGVHRAGCWNGSKTKKNWYWVANWCDENGVLRRKSFSIEKLGEDESKQAAINYRTEQVRLLEVNFRIKYSDRHGT
jgi:hypothetical protein